MMALRVMALLILVTLFVAGPAGGEEDEGLPRRTTDSRPGEQRRKDGVADVTPEQTKAVKLGLAWLARAQQDDGAIAEATDGILATTSLTLLTFMANGNTESRGRYSRNVRLGMRYLLRHARTEKSATFPAGYIHVPDDTKSKMHAHGYATLVLALAYGMQEPARTSDSISRRREMKTRLDLAVKVIEDAQDASGGWWYEPVRRKHEGSVTVTQIQALRAAREAGIKVKPETIRKAIRYLEYSQDEETGGFCYSLTDRDRQSYALTAAALSTLFGLGEYDRSRMIRSGLDYMKYFFDRAWTGNQSWFFYGNFYAAQAMWQASATERYAHYWKEWWPRMRDFLVEKQDRDGHWRPPGTSSSGVDGNAYRTAFATLILQIPMELLPIFQR